jgi:hypothetical protein
MAIQALIRSGDTIKVSRSFGIVGSAVISGSKSPVIVVAAANNNEPATQQELSINKPLVKMINALASIDGMIKQRLENQKIIGANQKLAQRESQIEQQKAGPQIEVIQPDAEKVSGSNAGLFALGGLFLLTLDPVQEAIKDLFDGVVSMGRFVTGVVSSINDAFKFLIGDSASTSEASAAAPVETPREGGVVATPAPPAQEGSPPTPTPATPTEQATPTERPSFFGEVGSAALTGAAIGSVIPRVGTAVGAAVGGAVGVYNYATGGSSSSAPPAASEPAATGGATTSVSPSTTPSTTASPDATKTTGTSGSVVQVNHPETGPGWGIAGATDASGRPLAFSKEGAEGFAKMMQDSGGAVKPSDVASSKRSVAKNREVDGATNSPHLRGVAMDIHGTSEPWIRQHGHKYGWKPHDYAGTHGGHFVFGGPGLTPDEGATDTPSGAGGASTLGQAVSNVANASLETMGKILGAIGGAIVDPGIPRTDIGGIVSAAASEYSAEVAANKTETPPSPPTPPAPPRINVTDSGAVQNPATGADRNSVYYYLRRFGFQDLSTPESALQPAS